MGDAPAAVGSADADRAATAERGRTGRPGAAAGRAPPPPSHGRAAVMPTATPNAELLGRDGLAGTIAIDGGEVVGYLAGQVRENQFWGTHAWVDHAAHACADPELARDLYAASAPAWIEAGARLHLAMVQATGEALDPWYRLGFGQMQVEGMRASGASPRPLPEGISIRLAGPDDLERVAREHGRLIWEQQQLSPRHSRADLARLGHAAGRLAGDVRRRVGHAVPRRARPRPAGQLALLPPAARAGGAGRCRAAGHIGGGAVRARPGSGLALAERRSPGRARPATARS